MGFSLEQPEIKRGIEKETKKSRVGMFSLEYNSNLTVKNEKGEVIFTPEQGIIDVHIMHKNQSESGTALLKKFRESLKELASYIAENRETEFKNIKIIRGITYEKMAKIAERLGFEIEEVDEKSIGVLSFKITGEYLHTNEAKQAKRRGREMGNFYAIHMPVDQFIQTYTRQKM